MNFETTPELNLDGAAFFRSIPYSIIIKQNSSHSKHKGVQNHSKNTLKFYEHCLESKKKNVVNYTFWTKNTKIQR